MIGLVAAGMGHLFSNDFEFVLADNSTLGGFMTPLVTVCGVVGILGTHTLTHLHTYTHTHTHTHTHI
jgi:hypothetical protein